MPVCSGTVATLRGMSITPSPSIRENNHKQVPIGGHYWMVQVTGSFQPYILRELAHSYHDRLHTRNEKPQINTLHPVRPPCLHLAAGKWLKSDLHAAFTFLLALETPAL
jgi:hypothetical protein